MKTQDHLADALFTASQSAVLGLLYGHPDETFYLREIVDATGLGVGHVQRELNRLAAAGILIREERGRHVYFGANPNCPIFEELRSIVLKTIGAADVLRRALCSLADRVEIAFIFGSVARADENAQSDIDLMVIGDVSFGDVVDAVRKSEKTLRRAVNPTVYPEAEFRDKVRSGNHFLNALLKREMIFLIGARDDLGNLLKQRLDQAS